MALNKNLEDSAGQIEQVAFEPDAVVPGISFSLDKMLIGRNVRLLDNPYCYRIGPDLMELLVNKPRVEGYNTSTFDVRWPHRPPADQRAGRPNSEGPRQQRDRLGRGRVGGLMGAMVRRADTPRAEDDDSATPVPWSTRCGPRRA